MRTAILIVVWAVAAASPAAADDGTRFRLTTPRGEIIDDGDELLVAIPAGRAWGITSGLQRLADAGATIAAEIEVRDPLVREAFLRVAYYERASGRPRQLFTEDSAAVAFGERARVEVRLEPPPDAVAYRARVLGRLVGEGERSESGAIAVRDLTVERASSSPEVRRTRLIAER